MQKTVFEENGISIFFQSARAKWNADLQNKLTDFINSCSKSLYCAIYDLTDTKVLQALKDKNQQGIDLHIAYNSSKIDKQHKNDTSPTIGLDPKPNQTEKDLERFGLLGVSKAIHDQGIHIMHDKFIIKDDSSVWTGSANFTRGGLQLQDNNCLIINSSKLSKIYRKVFNDLLDSSHGHPTGGIRRKKVEENILTHSNNPQITVGMNIKINPFFSPASGEDVEDACVSLLDKAKKVRIMAMLISDDGILNSLSRFADKKNNNSVDILGIYDLNQAQNAVSHKTDKSLLWFLEDHDRFIGVVTRKYDPHSSNKDYDFMHNKVMIIDDRFVITGSYNFSENAEGNDENLLIIESAKVAKAYTNYFDGLYSTYKNKK